jgi:hypothetical protein
VLGQGLAVPKAHRPGHQPQPGTLCGPLTALPAILWHRSGSYTEVLTACPDGPQPTLALQLSYRVNHLWASFRRQSASTRIGNGGRNTPGTGSRFLFRRCGSPGQLSLIANSLHLRQGPTTGPRIPAHCRPSGSRPPGEMRLPAPRERRNEQSCTAFRLPSYQTCVVSVIAHMWNTQTETGYAAIRNPDADHSARSGGGLADNSPPHTRGRRSQVQPRRSRGVAPGHRSMQKQGTSDLRDPRALQRPYRGTSGLVVASSE